MSIISDKRYSEIKESFLQNSPYDTDDGNRIGRDPRHLDVDTLREVEPEETPLKAVRAKCMDCASSKSEVRKCVQFDCPLWPYRMGSNPFYGKRH